MWLSKVVLKWLFLLFVIFSRIVSSEPTSLFDRFASNSSSEIAGWQGFLQNDKITGNLMGLKNVFLEIPMEIDAKMSENVIICLMETSAVTLFGKKDEQASQIDAKYTKNLILGASRVDFYFVIAKYVGNNENSFQYWKSLDSWNFQADVLILILDSKEINLKPFLMNFVHFVPFLSFLRSKVRIVQMATNSSITRIYDIDHSLIRRRPKMFNGIVTVYEKCFDCYGKKSSQSSFEMVLPRDMNQNDSYGQNHEKILKIAAQINEPYVFYSNGHLMGIDIDIIRHLAEFLKLQPKFDVLEKAGDISGIFNGR